MNFFEYQDKARFKTALLIIGFILSIIVIIFLIDAIFIYDNPIRDEMRKAGIPPIDLFTVNIIICLVILIGTLKRYQEISDGGKSIAKIMGATEVSRDSYDDKLKQLINVADEISIASGVAAPAIYILRNEKGINAFVAGYNPNDTVLVVTQGTLDNLSRDELQGVIAHEFSHIFNSDTTINLRLLIILGGLFMISQVGYMLMRTSRNSKNSLAPLGIFLYILGLIGLLCGNIIKAAVSRQRETLADASAVQYTRDPRGIARALLKIQDQGAKALMDNENAEKVNHMCFSKARELSFFSLFADHPPLETRIKELDPNGMITAEFLNKALKATPKPSPTLKNESAQTSFAGAVLAGTTILSADTIVESIGKPSAKSLAFAENIIKSIPDELKNMLNNVDSTIALIYALAISLNSTINLDRLKLQSNPVVKDLINQCLQIKELSNNIYRTTLLDLSIPILKSLNEDQKLQFLNNIDLIIEAEPNLTLGKAILRTILNQRLQSDAYKNIRPKFNFANQIRQQIYCILWFLAQQSSKSSLEQINALHAALRHLDMKTPENIATNFDIKDLVNNFALLRYMSPNLKQKFLEACCISIMLDGKTEADELALLRAICSCLNSPLPQIM